MLEKENQAREDMFLMKRERQIKDVKIFITDRYGLIHFAKKKKYIGQKIF